MTACVNAGSIRRNHMLATFLSISQRLRHLPALAAVDDTELNLGEKKKKKKKKVVLEDAVSFRFRQNQQHASMNRHNWRNCLRTLGRLLSATFQRQNGVPDVQDAMLGEDGAAPADEAEPAGDLDLGLTKKKKKKKPKVC